MWKEIEASLPEAQLIAFYSTLIFLIGLAAIWTTKCGRHWLTRLMDGILFHIWYLFDAGYRQTWGYQRQASIDHILEEVANLSSYYEFEKEMNALGLIKDQRLNLVGKMGVGIASEKVMAKLLAKLLTYANYPGDVIEAVYDHFNSLGRPFWRSKSWARKKTHNFIEGLATKFNTEEIAWHIDRRSDLYHQLDHFMRETLQKTEKDKKIKVLNAARATAQKAYKVVSVVEEAETIPSTPPVTIQLSNAPSQ